MQDELVSIIVAVYEGEKYLEDCLNSIKNQTYKNFEVILVDDGSEDSSGAICDSYTVQDSRFRVVHQKNSGCSAARNVGLSQAKGNYIGIIDQDDKLHREYIQYFMRLIKKEDVEIATTDTILPFVGEPPESVILNGNNYCVWTGADTAKAMLMYTLQIGPWNKLIKRSLIEENAIEFQEQFYCGEGFAFSVECFQATGKVAVGHENVYFYRIDNVTSGSSSFSIRKCESSLAAQDYMRTKLEDKSRYANNVLTFSKWRTVTDNFTLLKASHMENKFPQEYHTLKDDIRKDALMALRIPTKLKQKIRAIAYWISPTAAAICFAKYLNYKMKGKYS